MKNRLDSKQDGPLQVAFWLNVRNLAVLLSLLTKAIEPNSISEWSNCLQLSLFVRHQALSPMDIDEAFGVQLLPATSRKALPELSALAPWPVFGLWLPLRFGAPRLRCFRSPVLPQLRAAAEELLETCKVGLCRQTWIWIKKMVRSW